MVSALGPALRMLVLFHLSTSVSFSVKWVHIRLLKAQGPFITSCYLNVWDSKTG